MNMLITRARLMIKSFGNDDRVRWKEGEWPSRIFACGVHARYARLNTAWGMKFFAFEAQRDETFAIHKRLHKAGIGPAVHHKFQCRSKNGKMVFGYIMQHLRKTNQRIEDLRHRALREFNISDLHYDNVGEDDKGNLFVIDCSMSDDSPGYPFWELKEAEKVVTLV